MSARPAGSMWSRSKKGTRPLTTFAPGGTTVPLYTETGEKRVGVFIFGHVVIAFFASFEFIVTGLQPGSFLTFPRTTSLTSGVCDQSFQFQNAVITSAQRAHLATISVFRPIVKLENPALFDVARRRTVAGIDRFLKDRNIPSALSHRDVPKSVRFGESAQSTSRLT